MTNTDRDTHFNSFANNVLTAMMGECGYIDLYDSDENEKARYAQIIAQNAYDLVGHTIENTEHIDLDRLSTQEHILKIPDMPVVVENTERKKILTEITHLAEDAGVYD